MRRRTFLSAAPLLSAAAAGLLVPRVGLSRSASERKFLFIFARGGWDTTFAFTPMFDVPGVAMEEGAVLAEAGGVPFVDVESRPSVRSFFEEHGHRTCVLNGIEVRSITHERCRRILFTGSGDGGDGWPTILAARASSSLLLPHLVIAGPAYTRQHAGQVVRVGDNGQLPALLDGTALQTSSYPVTAPPSAVEAIEDAFVRQRAAASGLVGQKSSFYEKYGVSLDNIDSLTAYSDDLDLSPGTGGCSRNIDADAATIFDAFSLGLARCGLTEHEGWCSQGWDTHQGNDMQDLHFEELFGFLRVILDDLDSRVGLSGAPLSEEVTVVVISEMGRHPVLNSYNGKDHWTYTSAMIIGAGVAGGQAIGALNDDGQGVEVDPSTGEERDGGLALQAQDLGATLLAMGDVDPGDYAPEATVIAAMMA